MKAQLLRKSLLAWVGLTALCLLLFNGSLQAQNIFDAIRYNSMGTAYDARMVATPGFGVSNFNGAGTFIDNPAAVGFTKDSFADFSFAAFSASADGSFLGVPYEDNNGRPAIGNLHYAYKFPTYQGSLVVGGGYSRRAVFDRYINAAGFNDTHSMTDFFAQNDFYFEPAFNTYAIDTLADGYPESALRIDGFGGIEQNLEVIEQGQIGEWSLYGAMEFQKNLMIGASIGFQTGNYRFRRNLTEVDRDNFYNFDRTDYDVRFITLEDRIDADISGLIYRVGAAYKLGPIRLGASVQLPSVISLDEEFSSEITTIFDRENTSEPPSQVRGRTNYEIRLPARYNLGLSAEITPKLTIAGALNYSDHASIEFDGIDDALLELDLNQQVAQNLQATSSYHASVVYSVPKMYDLRFGYSHIPSSEQSFDLTTQNVFSFGGGIEMYGGWQFNFGVTASQFEDVYVGYEAQVTGDETLYSLSATENVLRAQVFAGFSYRF